MPIKVVCTCGQQFAAKDELAGKVVKCPKCKQPLKVGGAQPAATPVGGGLGDLLDEVGFHVHEDEEQAQYCPACDAKMSDHAIICVQCGFHLETGKFSKGVGGGPLTAAQKAEGHAGAAEMLLRKAQHAISQDSHEERKMRTQGAPVWALLASVVIIACLAVSLSVMPRKAALMTSGVVWVSICMLVYTYYWIVLIVTAFMENVVQGLLFMFVPLYSLYYVITRWADCRRAFLICIFSSILALGGWGLIVWSASMSFQQAEQTVMLRLPDRPADLSQS
jgi:hypothetical protein